MTPPPTRYAQSPGGSIAYQVFGEGPVDLAIIGGPASHVDLEWDNPCAERALERLATFARVVRFDRRGTGASDPVERVPTLEQQMDDLRAVLDAAGLERVAVWGGTDAGLAAMFAATYPDRVSSLVLWGVTPRGADVVTPELAERMADALENYGSGGFGRIYAPTDMEDRFLASWWCRYERGVASPGTARKILELILQADVSSLLPSIRVPTLVLHRTDDTLVPLELGRELASRIPDARFVELSGRDNYVWAGDWETEVEPAIEAVEEFLTGSRGTHEPDRVLATVLVTDIVGSTRHAAQLGDKRWREVLASHNDVVRSQLERWRGREIKNEGDGFLATFDGPARAVECARAIVREVESLGVRVRAGVHTGEVEHVAGEVNGIAVRIGARVADVADGGEVVVSNTVRDLVVGSGLSFEDKGAHELEGVPGEWHLFALAD